MRLAKEAKELGIELFVLDDGWFGERNNDKAGLGDYTVNSKKITTWNERPLRIGSEKIGLDFGLWFEPENDE